MNKPITPEEFAFALVAHRERLGYTQAEMQKLLDVRIFVTYQLWEDGRVTPDSQLTIEGALARCAKAPVKK